jgi:hypothetical protein
LKTTTRLVLLGPPPRDEPELEARAATSTRIQQVDFIIIVDGEELLENCLLSIQFQTSAYLIASLKRES